MISRLLTAAVVLAALAAPASAQLSKDAKLLVPFKPIVEKASGSTVRIKCDDKDAILGTIVDPDGFILTKLSELKGAVYVRLPDGSEYEATTVAAHKDTDLALLKVDVKGLKAVTFAASKTIPQGSWLVAAGPTSDPVSVGIVSVMTRKLTGSDARIANNNRGYMGVIPVDEKDSDGNLIGAKITELSEGMAAEKAGLKVDDIIIEMNGKKVVSQATLRAQLDTLKGGEVAAVKVTRKGETKDFKMTLSSAPLDRGDKLNSTAACCPAAAPASRRCSRRTWWWTRSTAAARWSISTATCRDQHLPCRPRGDVGAAERGDRAAAEGVQGRQVRPGRGRGPGPRPPGRPGPACQGQGVEVTSSHY